MNCPFCGSQSHKVVDKRSVLLSGEIRRRRECLKCAHRFTTYEKLANLDLVVIKRDGKRESFLTDKLLTGIKKSLEKRPAEDRAEYIAQAIERKLRRRGNKEVPSKLIGQMVLTELKKVDPVAYLRFASVYRRFDQPEDFARELNSIKPKEDFGQKLS